METRVWKDLLSLDWGVLHLCRLFTPLFTHCHPQLIPPGDWAACPPRGPWTHPGPLWMPNWAYHTADWINSSLSGTFSPLYWRGRGPLFHTSIRALYHQHRGQSWGRGGGSGVLGSVVESVQKTCLFCWQTEAGYVNRGANRGLCLHRTTEVH